MSEKDVKDASTGVLQDLKRFQKDKETDLRRYMVGALSYQEIFSPSFYSLCLLFFFSIIQAELSANFGGR